MEGEADNRRVRNKQKICSLFKLRGINKKYQIIRERHSTILYELKQTPLEIFYQQCSKFTSTSEMQEKRILKLYGAVFRVLK